MNYKLHLNSCLHLSIDIQFVDKIKINNKQN
jgi:hypothetical protein